MELNLPLERQLVAILRDNLEDSYATQRARGQVLLTLARALHEHFGLQKWANLGQKHVTYVVETWKAADRGRRAIEGRLTHLRWLVRKIGKANLVPRTNEELDIEPGPRHTRAGKVIPDARFREILAALPEARLRMAFLLARYLGMRFKEAMLFRPWRDFDGQRVWVKRGSKGGRPRYLFLHNEEQRAVLSEARALVSGDASLVPRDVPTFAKWRGLCYRRLRAAGVSQANGVVFHDARRTYAVERMKGLVERGFDQERAARLVSRELGHNRTEILAWYLAHYVDKAVA